MLCGTRRLKYSLCSTSRHWNGTILCGTSRTELGFLCSTSRHWNRKMFYVALVDTEIWLVMYHQPTLTYHLQSDHVAKWHCYITVVHRQCLRRRLAIVRRNSPTRGTWSNTACFRSVDYPVTRLPEKLPARQGDRHLNSVCSPGSEDVATAKGDYVTNRASHRIFVPWICAFVTVDYLLFIYLYIYVFIYLCIYILSFPF
jgi:hypothetical protein